MDNLKAPEQKKHSAGLESYAQRQPMGVFNNEAFEMYESMREDIKQETVVRLFAFRWL